MTTEFEVLGLVSDRLSAYGLRFILTGSIALTPRMTRDLDIVVVLNENDVDGLVAAFQSDFYIDADAARTLMHLESGVKVDLIIRKSSEFRQVEFGRRQPVTIAGIRTWIVSGEDLILSKLVRALNSNSEIAATRHLQAGRRGYPSGLYSQMGATLGRRDAAQRTDAMNDTSAKISKIVDDHHLAMTPAERLLAASSLFESARKIVESSLPGHLKRRKSGDLLSYGASML